jgi:ABC-type polysaccharide/polyol phosphate export permease
MIDQLRSIWQRREVLFYLVKYELKAENKNKVLGFLWSFLDPLLLLVTYIVLVVFIFQRSEPQFPILLFSALLSWRWFISSLSGSVNSVTSKVGLVRTVRFPLAILPLTKIIGGFFDLMFGFVILLPMLFIFEANFSVNMLWLPVLLLIQLIGTIGASLICAVLGTYLSDLTNIIQFVLRLWFYMSPVMYSVQSRIPERYQTIYWFVNPFAGLLESYKNILVRGLPPSEYVAVAAVMAVVVFVVGFWYFARDEHKLVKAI